MGENGTNCVLSDKMEDLLEEFNTIDLDGNGFLEEYELQHALEVVGFKKAHYEVRDLVKEFDCKIQDGRLDFNEFKHLCAELRKQDHAFQALTVVKPREGLEDYGTEGRHANDDTKHSIRKREQVAFSNWINRKLANDSDCDRYLPLHPEGKDLAEKCKDGILICKMINCTKPGTIDERALNKGDRLSVFQKLENLQVAVNSARAIGCMVVNNGPVDLEKGTLHLLLGMLWQIIKVGLLSEVNVAAHTELVTLINEDESLTDFYQSSPEAILIRWVNYHLKRAGEARGIQNLTSDIQDSVAYAHLLEQIAPIDKKGEMKSASEIMLEADPHQRAELVLSNAEVLEARQFVSAGDIVAGNHNLNLAFVANLFKTYSGLDDENGGGLNGMNGTGHLGENGEEIDPIMFMEETREERTYRNWMNSLHSDISVRCLYYDLRSGLVLFKIFDVIRPGSVNWSRVKVTFKRRLTAHMEKLENCNYAVELGLATGFSLVGVGGEDIYRGNVTLTLALVWQLMRAYTLVILQRCTKADKPITEREIIEWANGKLTAGTGSTVPSVSGFNDHSLSDGRIILNLINAVRPGKVDASLVKSGRTNEECFQNATYAITMARKIGASVYALPEDITEVKPKMIMTIFACLMIVDSQKPNGS